MPMPPSDRRGLFGLGAAAAALAAAAPAAAQGTAPAGSLQRIRDRGELRIGTPSTEPWFFKDQRSGEWHGIGWGVGVVLAQALGVRPVAVETTWGTAAAGLQTDQFDVLFCMDATPERALALDFPPQAMFYYAQAALLKDGVQARTWEELNKPELRLGVILGTSPDRDLTARMTRAQIERFPNGDEAAAAFQAGRVDALSLFHPALVLLRNRLRRGTIVLPEPIRLSATSAGVRRDPDKSWRDWLGLSMDYLYQTGATQKIYTDYLAFRRIDPAGAPGLVREQWNRPG